MKAKRRWRLALARARRYAEWLFVGWDGLPADDAPTGPEAASMQLDGMPSTPKRPRAAKGVRT